MADAGHIVLAASRSADRAAEVAPDDPRVTPVVLGADARPTPDVRGNGIVVNCTGEEDTATIEAWLRRGWDAVDITASSQYSLDLESLPSTGSTLLVGVGLMPGLSSLMAAELADTDPGASQITLSGLLGLADDHGPASSRWSLGGLGELVADAAGAFRNFSHPRAITFPGGFGRRRAWRYDFADRAMLPTRIGTEVDTRYCFDSRVAGEAMALAGRIPGAPTALLRTAPLLQHSPWGTDWWALVAQTDTGQRLEALGRSQSQATALLTFAAIGALQNAAPDPGPHHITDITSLRRTEPLLPALGIMLNRG
ncbi:hypothetical protein PO878_04465 [Iamia majanohamensis]|uniref:Saccharopine dehydrogenase n=1 Tax=Iamia majanohamensis TaxID=467976 RepID=A0AAE9YHP1_9ACTN|nr:hypothetical protein [Iamia majanohamensis]WCO67976.1 hypothetical protein PO878_04465 [Iamia majanohamensis]